MSQNPRLEFTASPSELESYEKWFIASGGSTESPRKIQTQSALRFFAKSSVKPDVLQRTLRFFCPDLAQPMSFATFCACCNFVLQLSKADPQRADYLCSLLHNSPPIPFLQAASDFAASKCSPLDPPALRSTSSVASLPVPTEKRAIYDKHFSNLDVDSRGYVTGEQCFSLFTKSGLDNVRLGRIWDLCVSPNATSSVLTREEFINAMHLISECCAGRQLNDPALHDGSAFVANTSDSLLSSPAVSPQQQIHASLANSAAALIALRSESDMLAKTKAELTEDINKTETQRAAHEKEAIVLRVKIQQLNTEIAALRAKLGQSREACNAAIDNKRFFTETLANIEDVRNRLKQDSSKSVSPVAEPIAPMPQASFGTLTSQLHEMLTVPSQPPRDQTHSLNRAATIATPSQPPNIDDTAWKFPPLESESAQPIGQASAKTPPQPTDLNSPVARSNGKIQWENEWASDAHPFS